MNKKKMSLLACLLLVMALMLSACAQSAVEITTSQFKDACEKDGLTVTMEASPMPEYEGIKEYDTASHGTNDILVERMVFDTEEQAQDAFSKICSAISIGGSGNTDTIKEKAFTTYKVNADKRYTKVTVSGTNIISAGGPTMYKSQLDRIMMKFGF